jgi:hypothetical protein
MATATETSNDHATPHVPIMLRIVLLVIGVVTAAGFLYGNAHTEDFRLAHPRFEPPLWNLYLTFALLSLVGLFGLWYGRRWGFWMLVILAAPTMAIEIFAMGFQFATLRIPIVVAVIWFAAQPAWKSFR